MHPIADARKRPAHLEGRQNGRLDPRSADVGEDQLDRRAVGARELHNLAGDERGETRPVVKMTVRPRPAADLKAGSRSRGPPTERPCSLGGPGMRVLLSLFSSNWMAVQWPQ